MASIFRIVVAGQTFDVTHGAEPGMVSFAWISGPNEGYGFSAARTDGSLPSREEAESLARDFLEMIDPATGFIAD